MFLQITEKLNEYIYKYTFVSPFEIINIPCTQGDRIHVCIYIYVNQYDENLLNIFLICCLKPSVTVVLFIWILATDIRTYVYVGHI